MSPSPTTSGESKQTARTPSRAELNRLLEERIILLSGEIDDDLAHIVIAQLLFLDSEDPTRMIHLYIDSFGGSITAGLAIHDTLQSIQAPVSTRGMGQALSMAAILLAGGERGEREALPDCQVMITKPWSQNEPKSALELHELQRLTRALAEILARDTGRSAQQIEIDMDLAEHMSAQEALDCGYIDRIL